MTWVNYLRESRGDETRAKAEACHEGLIRWAKLMSLNLIPEACGRYSSFKQGRWPVCNWRWSSCRKYIEKQAWRQANTLGAKQRSKRGPKGCSGSGQDGPEPRGVGYAGCTRLGDCVWVWGGGRNKREVSWTASRFLNRAIMCLAENAGQRDFEGKSAGSESVEFEKT